MSTISATDKNATMADVKQDIHRVKENLSTLGVDAKEVASAATERAVDAVRTGAETSKDVVKDLGEQAQQYHNTVVEQVVKHPTTSILVAVGVGAILGKMLSR
ncbi:MAG: hypothetical protein AAF138_07260 [Planctomycetota bacterium]